VAKIPPHTPSTSVPATARSQPARSQPARLTRAFLGALCFLSWASVMIVEICAYRLLAPLFGNSVFTWTALIGVILIASSAGGYLGGWLADRRPALDMMGWLLAGSSILVFIIPSLHDLIGPTIAAGGHLVTGPVFVSLILFAVPGILLGAVSPAAVRFYSLTSRDTHVGASAGVISMLGSLGSFTGTFLSGFFLISTFGVRSIFFGVAVLLLALAVLAFFLARKSLGRQLPVLLAALLAAAASLSSHPSTPAGVIHEEESYYHRIRVTEQGSSPHKRRLLELDSTQEGGMNPDTGELVLAYQHYWRLAQLNDKLKIERALFLGAGAFGMPNELSRSFPNAHVDVAEIDPRVINVGRRFFQLDAHPRVHAHPGDARRFLQLQNDSALRWDLIFGDAYNGIRAIPVHLTSREFFQLVHDRLSDDGAFIMNVISAIQGPRGELLAGLHSTVRSVFPHVEVFSVGGRLDELQNVILLATKSNWNAFITDRFHPQGSLLQRIVATHVPASRLPPPVIAFTDDKNPVDAIIARGLKTR
jgi:spermidine synthase